MQPITRRDALILGGLGTASVLAGGAGLLWRSGAGFNPATGTALSEPRVLRSTNGVLELRLSAAAGPAQIAGRRVTALIYNSGLPGPTLLIRPGDVLRVKLENGLREPTNLHVHGLHVSPEGNSDNMFISIQPGDSFDYEYRLPTDHPPGVYWYHPHHHGMVADQIFGGLYGAIIVEDPNPIAVTRERVLVISDITFNASGDIPPSSDMERMMGREGELVLVNGQGSPQLTARPGERERWRIVNACVARYLNLNLDGQQMQLLGIDSGRLPAPRDITKIVLAPGNRADLLVTTIAGKATLTTRPVDRGSAMGMVGGGAAGSRSTVSLAEFDVTGKPGIPLAPVPPQPQQRDLRQETITGSRELTFAMGMGMGMGMGGNGGMMSFTIDGKTFDAQRIDTIARAGGVEEWTLTNTSPMDHPIHLHVWPMQIIETGGVPTTGSPLWQDVVNVPARSSTRVRIAFDHFTGKTVYHCHILDHEDSGMMGVVDAR